MSGQSSDPSPTRTEGSHVNLSSKFNLQFLIINMSVPLLLQGFETGAQDHSMPLGPTGGGQMMLWVPPLPGMAFWPPMQTQMSPPMPWGFPPRGQSHSPGAVC
jgi:hypothetical protein